MDPRAAKTLCGLAVRVLAKPAKPFSVLDRAIILSALAWSRKEHHIAHNLMRALCTVIDHMLLERVSEGALATLGQPR